MDIFSNKTRPFPGASESVELFVNIVIGKV